jgi:hypothetical protein
MDIGLILTRKINPSHVISVWMQIFVFGYTSLRLVFKKLVKAQKMQIKNEHYRQLQKKLCYFRNMYFGKPCENHYLFSFKL